MKWVALALSLPCLGQDCLEFAKAVKLDGRIVIRDDRGYRQVLILELGSPICTSADRSRDTLVSLRVSELRLYAEGDKAETLNRLNKLAGQRAAVTGTLAPAASGYDGARVVFSASAVEPLDAAGERALGAKPGSVNTPEAYKAVLRSGRRLAVEVRDPKSGKTLEPVRQYVDYWLTPGGVLWARCRDGYALRSGLVSPEESGECDEQQCFLSKPLYETATITIQCQLRPQ